MAARPPAPAEEQTAESQLEAELVVAREDLRLTIEQLEGSNEELKASNEEIRSINEELQASNEELETSKEELQSLNEELNTVNSQLQAKLDELEGQTDDLNNLLNSTEIATLFLDHELRVRWFTPTVKALLELLPADIGRPVAHLAPKFKDGDLVPDAAEVMRTLVPRRAEVVSNEGRWYVRQILPYRTESSRINGVVVTFVDITDLKQSAQALADAKEFSENIVDTIRQPLLVLDFELRVRSANASFCRSFAVDRARTIGRPLLELDNQGWDIPKLRRLLDQLLPEHGTVESTEVELDLDMVGHRTMRVNARQIANQPLILLAIEDITEQRHVQASLAQARFQSLTRREREVMSLVVAGHQNKEIAAQLGISQRTVETHRARLMDKIGVRSVAELVRLAILAGLETGSARTEDPNNPTAGSADK